MYVNWYKLAQIEKEAGLKEYIPAALLSALIAIMGNSAWRGYADRQDIDKAAQEFGVSQSDIENALNNKQVVDAINKYQNSTLPQGKDNMNNTTPLTKGPEQTKKNQEQSQEQKIQINIIARTLYAEGKSESEEGLKAIASVIYNRSNKTPSGMVAVIKQPKQFSCWNQASEKDWTNMKQNSGPMWDKSMEIAKSMVNGSFQPSGTWEHYFNPNKVKPNWAYKDKGKTQPHKYVDIGNHRFLVG